MGVSIGSTTLNEVNNNAPVLEVQNNICGIERVTAIGGRNAGDQTGVYAFEDNININHSSGGMPNTGEYEAPYDGIYMIYLWFMIDNANAELNDYYDIEINGGFYQRVYGSNNGDGTYREFATGVIAELSAGDTMRVRCRNVRLYGANNRYTRWNSIYLG